MRTDGQTSSRVITPYPQASHVPERQQPVGVLVEALVAWAKCRDEQVPRGRPDGSESVLRLEGPGGWAEAEIVVTEADLPVLAQLFCAG